MKTRLILALLAATALTLAGCSKKEEPKPQPAPSVTPTEKETQETTDLMDTMKETVEKTVEETTESLKQSFTMDVDLKKNIDELKIEASKMSLDDLKAVATKYKNAISEKNIEIDKLADKLQAIPMTEKLGAEAQKLTAEFKALGESLKPLTDRFQVYVDAIKAKGGDFSGLTL